MNYGDIKEPVLLVDDDAEIIALLNRVVADLGLSVVSAPDGPQALEAAKASPPFLVISDFRMPVMNGICLFQRLSESSCGLPFILLTAFADKGIAIEALNQGIAKIIEKPVSIETIAEAVRTYADRRLAALAAEREENDLLVQAFREEARELMHGVEQLVLKLETDAQDPVVVDLLFRKMHSVKGGAGFIPGTQAFVRLAHAFESILCDIKKTHASPDQPVVDCLLAATDMLVKAVHSEDASSLSLDPGAVESLCASLDAAWRNSLSREKAAAAAGVAPKAAQEESTEVDGINVASEKLDALMKICGELVVLKNSFQALTASAEEVGAGRRHLRKLGEFNQAINRFSDDLQGQIMSIRRVSVEQALSKVQRLFRQTCKDLGKKAALRVSGFNLQVDKNIAKALSVAVTHLVRNALDHGIEHPGGRAAAGKPETGTLAIDVKERDGLITFRLQDDGAGIHRERVTAKAVSSGICSDDAARRMSDAEVFDLIFMPGFSTAEKVSDVSGRGVGMDAVKSAVLSVHGRLLVESAMGKGAAFTLEIPVPKTVIVEQTIVVKVGDARLALPLRGISHITSFAQAEATEVGRCLTVQHQGRTVRVIGFESLAAPSSPAKSIDGRPDGSIIVLHDKSGLVGLYVNAVEGHLEAVIRPFDAMTGRIKGFKGVTVLDDERVAYVVDPEEVVAMTVTGAPAGADVQKGAA